MMEYAKSKTRKHGFQADGLANTMDVADLEASIYGYLGMDPMELPFFPILVGESMD